MSTTCEDFFFLRFFLDLGLTFDQIEIIKCRADIASAKYDELISTVSISAIVRTFEVCSGQAVKIGFKDLVTTIITTIGVIAALVPVLIIMIYIASYLELWPRIIAISIIVILYAVIVYFVISAAQLRISEASTDTVTSISGCVRVAEAAFDLYEETQAAALDAALCAYATAVCPPPSSTGDVVV